MKIIYFHRNKNVAYSIDKVTQTIISGIEEKQEFYVPGKTASIRDVLKNIIYVYNNRSKKCINHVTGDIHYCLIGLIGCKSVLTIHDTVMVDYNSMSRIKRLFLEYLWLRLPLKIATKVICISNETKKKVERFTNRKDIIVIHNAISPSFTHYGYKELTTKPNVLLIGTKQNKNLKRTFQALSSMKCKVTIIGKLSSDYIEYLYKNNIDYVNKFDLTDDEIVNEYVEADVVSFISLFEGFGMPVIEANMVGRPVICSNIAVLKEVAGEAAYFVNPYKVDEIRNGFDKLFSDRRLRMTLVKNGFKNVERFNPDKQRLTLLQLYESINNNDIINKKN